MPKKFRRELGTKETFYILLGDNGGIWGFDQANWERLARSVLNLPISSTEGIKQRLKFFPRAEECGLDNQGRFILPQEFVDSAKLAGEVLMVGAGDHFEIWQPERWKLAT